MHDEMVDSDVFTSHRFAVNDPNDFTTTEEESVTSTPRELVKEELYILDFVCIFCK